MFGPDEIDRGRRSRGQGADAIDLGSTLAREIVRIDAQFSHTRDPRANGSLTEIVARSLRLRDAAAELQQTKTYENPA